MNKRVSKEWNELTSKYQKADLAERLMIEYFSEGSYVKVAKKYNVTSTCIISNINKYIAVVYEEKPYIVDLYKAKAQENKIKGSMDEPRLKKFDIRMFETLPVEMEYTKFLDVVRKYDTDMLTGEYLARLAKKNDIKLYNIDLYSGAKKYIKF